MKTFKREGTFWWYIGQALFLLGLLLMLTPNELKDMKEALDALFETWEKVDAKLDAREEAVQSGLI